MENDEKFQANLFNLKPLKEGTAQMASTVHKLNRPLTKQTLSVEKF